MTGWPLLHLLLLSEISCLNLHQERSTNMAQAENGPLIPRLVAVLARGRAATHEVMSRLGDADITTNGSGGDWTFKDMLAHVAAWQHVTAASLNAAANGTTPPATGDETAFNEARLAASRELPWPAVLEDHENAYNELTAAVQASAADDLISADRFPWRNERPLWTAVLGNGYLHPIEHLAN